MESMSSLACEGLLDRTEESVHDLQRQIAESIQRAQRLTRNHAKSAAIHECLLFLHKALACISEDGEEFWDTTVQIDWKNLGKRLKLKRMQANLGQKELADLVDISDGMVRAIEAGLRRPSREVLLRLLAAPQLGLRLEEIASDSANDGVVPTSWLAPHYNPSAMISEMVEQLNGAGGSLEQTTAYLDYQSAKDCLDIFNSPSYLNAFSNTAALDHMAQQIVETCGAGGLDIIALGCGDAKREIKLVESIVLHGKTRGITNIRLFLLDISHSLLTVGHAAARETLGNSVKSVIALHGNFHDLPKYPLYGERDIRTRTRVFTMLGCTLANIDNEVRFFRDTMSSAAKGDCFLTDFTNTYASADRPDEVRATDPGYQGGVRDSYKTWLSGPLRRYVKGLSGVEFSLELSTDCTVRGSYELTYVTNLTVDGTPSRRRFVVFRVRRYDAEKLHDFLHRCGWHKHASLAYGTNDRSNITLSLLVRA
jgi:transcriptional regulator with XRE-family HTH domain